MYAHDPVVQYAYEHSNNSRPVKMYACDPVVQYLYEHSNVLGQ